MPTRASVDSRSPAPTVDRFAEIGGRARGKASDRTDPRHDESDRTGGPASDHASRAGESRSTPPKPSQLTTPATAIIRVSSTGRHRRIDMGPARSTAKAPGPESATLITTPAPTFQSTRVKSSTPLAETDARENTTRRGGWRAQIRCNATANPRRQKVPKTNNVALRKLIYRSDTAITRNRSTNRNNVSVSIVCGPWNAIDSTSTFRRLEQITQASALGPRTAGSAVDTSVDCNTVGVGPSRAEFFFPQRFHKPTFLKNCTSMFGYTHVSTQRESIVNIAPWENTAQDIRRLPSGKPASTAVTVSSNLTAGSSISRWQFQFAAVRRKGLVCKALATASCLSGHHARRRGMTMSDKSCGAQVK